MVVHLSQIHDFIVNLQLLIFKKHFIQDRRNHKKHILLREQYEYSNYLKCIVPFLREILNQTNSSLSTIRPKYLVFAPFVFLSFFKYRLLYKWRFFVCQLVTPAFWRQIFSLHFCTRKNYWINKFNLINP